MSEFKIEKVLKECTQLPSGFGFYPKNVKIWFSPMTTREVELLNESEISSKLLFENALANITTEGMDKRDLTFSDFIFISLQRRVYSQQEIRATIKTQCKNCGKVITHDFDFNEIEFNKPKDNRLQTCELCGYRVEVGPLTVGNMLDLLNQEDGFNTIDTLAHCIKKIYEPNSEIKDIYTYDIAKEIISNTWGDDRKKLDYIATLHEHSMKPRTIECSNCQTSWGEDLGSAETLIFPYDGLEQSIKDQVSPC